MAKLNISLFQTFQARIGAAPAQGFKSDKARALLAYLALESSRPHARSSLAGLLWPDLPETTAHSNLRSVLANLRLILEKKGGLAGPLLLADYQTIQLVPGEFTCDVLEFENNILAGRLGEAAAGYAGRLLQEFYSGSALFDDWQQMRAEKLHQNAMQVFSSQIRDHLQSGNISLALQLSQRQVGLDPTNEEYHQILVYLLASNGQRGTALKQFDQCRQMLARDLGVKPSSDLLALRQAIQNGQKLPLPKSMSVRNATALTAIEAPYHLPVSRSKEIGFLKAHLAAALNGQGRTIFVTGDAGSGKTSLVEAFIARVSRDYPELLVLGSGCSIHNGLAAPLLPFREIFLALTQPGNETGRFMRAQWNAARQLNQANRLITRLMHEVAPDLNSLLKMANPSLPIDLAERSQAVFNLSFQQGSLFQQTGSLIESLARRYPLLIALDDLQWIDTESLDLLLFLTQRLKQAPVLIVGIYRQDEVAAGQDGRAHPLERCVNELERLNGDICLDLNLSDGRAFVEEYLDSLPNRFRPEFRETLFQHTGGHALFTVEMVESLQKMGYLRQEAQGCWVENGEIDWSRLPARVEAILNQRIKRLPVFWQSALSTASVEGERFTAEALAQVLESKPSAVVKGLSRIAGRQHGLIDLEEMRMIHSQRVTIFRFRHFIYQHYLYTHLDAGERSILHEAVGQALEQIYQENNGDLALIAPQLAHHFEQAGRLQKAAGYYSLSGHAAIQTSAFYEAEKHLNRAYALQRQAPPSAESDRLGLDILSDLSLVTLVLHGWGSEERMRILSAAQELAARAAKPAEQLLILSQLTGNILGSGQIQPAIEKSRQFEELARRAGQPSFIALAQMLRAEALIFLGRLTEGLTLMEAVLSYIDQHRDDPLFEQYNANEETARIFYSFGLMMAGRVAQAGVELERALAAARSYQSALIMGLGLTAGGALQSLLLEDPAGVRQYAEELRTKMVRREYQVYQPWMDFLDLWGSFQDGQQPCTLEELTAWAETWNSKSGFLGYPFLLRTLADALRQGGRAAEGEKLLGRILRGIEKNGGNNVLKPDVIRLRGECQLERGDDPAAEASFAEALAVAEEQGALFFELSAANSLCRLKLRQHDPAQAAARLRRICDCFSPELDVAPLRSARRLLAASQD